MANPQPDKYVRISTELLNEILGLYELNGTDCMVLFWIIRNTYGWQRKMTAYSWPQVAREIGRPLRSVKRAGKNLIDLNILYKKGFQVGPNKNYDLWKAAWNPWKNRAKNVHSLGPKIVGSSYARDHDSEREFSPISQVSRSRSGDALGAPPATREQPKRQVAPYIYYCPTAFPCDKCGAKHLPVHPCKPNVDA